MQTGGETSQRDNMLRWAAAHRTMLAAYVNAMVRNPDLTNDVLGDLMVVIAEKGAEYDSERPLGPLLRGIARNLSLRALTQRNRQPLVVDPDVLDEVSEELDRLDDTELLDLRMAALQHCIERLTEAGRLLVDMRYFRDMSYMAISVETGSSENALQARMYRIHRSLEECIEAQTGAAS